MVSPFRETAQISTRTRMFRYRSLSRRPFRAESLGRRYSTSSSRPLEKDSSFMAAGNRSTRAISRAAAFSGLMAMERPSSSRMKRSCVSYSGLRIRAMVCRTPSFFATRHAKIFSSSLETVAISRSARPTSASFCTS